MKNISLPSIAAVIILSLGLLWIGGKSQATFPSGSEIANKGGNLIVSEALYDFGNISMADGLVRTRFIIQNTTNNDILVEGITTSCMCTSAYIIEPEGRKRGPYGMPGHYAVPKANEIIKAKENMTLEVVYDPNAHGPAGVGWIDRFVFLESDSGEVLQLEITANVTP